MRLFWHNSISRAATPLGLAEQPGREVLMSLLAFGQRQGGRQCSHRDWGFKPHVSSVRFGACGAAPCAVSSACSTSRHGH